MLQEREARSGDTEIWMLSTHKMQSKGIHSLLLSVSSHANGCYKQLSIIALKPWLQDAALKEMNASNFVEYILNILFSL